MAREDDYTDPISIKIITDYKEATKNTQSFVKMIDDLAKHTKQSFRDVAKSLVDIFPQFTSHIKGAVKILEQAKMNQKQWAQEAERTAKAYEKIRFSQAKAKVKNLFVDDDFLNSIGQKAKQAREEFNKTFDEVDKKSKKGLLSFSNLMRTIFGTLTAVGVFQVLTSITTFFQTVFKKAQDFRGELLELNLAENILSQKGMDITRKDFDDLIAHIRERYMGLSELEATKIVAETATAVQEFDVNAEQYKGLTDAIAFVETKNKLLGKEAVDAGHIMNALMDARSNFFNGMGINITEQLILEKAYAMGLLKTGEAMSKEIRFQASLALFIEQTSSKQDELNKALENTPLGNQIALQEEWDDAMLRVGKSLITIKDNLIESLSAMSPGLANGVVDVFINLANKVNEFIDALQKASEGYENLTKIVKGTNLEERFEKWGEFLKDVKGFATFPFEILLALLQGIATFIATITAGLVTFFAEAGAGLGWKTAFEDAGRNAGEAYVQGMSMALSTVLKGEDSVIANWIKEQWKKATGIDVDLLGNTTKSVTKASDTPTGTSSSNADELLEEEENLKKALEKMNNEILESQIKLAQDMEEAQIDLGRKLVDIAKEYARKRADVERDYANTVSDIQSDYANDIADIEADQAEQAQEHRNDELQREAEFQNEMQELKENYLMDLEEALHARDARAVLRLTKQYNLDKLQAERQRELERQNSQREEAEARADFQRRKREAERERKMRLAEAKREHEEKLAQLKADEEAEKKQAELDYQRKIEDLNREMHDRLEILGASLIAEFNLTKDGLNAILELYSRYYSEIAGIYNAMNTMLQNTPTPSPSGYSPNSQYQGGDYTAPTNHVGGHIAFAEGGSMIANKPTKAVFGEAGMELATFTPLGKSGKNVNKLFSNLDTPAGSMGGKTIIEVLLSPDLEGRIITNSLNQTAEIIQQVNRSK